MEPAALAAGSPRIAARTLISSAGIIRLSVDPALALASALCLLRPCIAGTGEHDRFLPPRRLAPALRQAMGLDLRILPGMGHLTTPGHFDDVVSLIAEAACQADG